MDVVTKKIIPVPTRNGNLHHSALTQSQYTPNFSDSLVNIFSWIIKTPDNPQNEITTHKYNKNVSLFTDIYYLYS